MAPSPLHKWAVQSKHCDTKNLFTRARSYQLEVRNPLVSACSKALRLDSLLESLHTKDFAESAVLYLRLSTLIPSPPSITVEMSAALKNCADAVSCLRDSDKSHECLESDAQSQLPPPQDIIAATQTAPKPSEDGLTTYQEPIIAYESPQHDNQSCSPPQEESDTERTSYGTRGPICSREDDLDVPITSIANLASGKLVRTILPGFPAEILLIIGQYLPSSSLMSLSYSCRTIRKKMGVTIEQSLGEKNQVTQLSNLTLCNNLPRLKVVDWRLPGSGIRYTMTTMTQNLHHSERLELLYMLDRDNKIPKSKAVCSGCADTHNQSLFSLESLAQSSRERHCLGSAGRLWICPHWVFDHNLITTSAQPHWSHTCGGKGWQVLAPNLDDKKSTVVVEWPIAVIRGKDDAPSKKLVEDVLSQMNVCICKHLRINDPFVSRLYTPECLRLRWMGNQISWPEYCWCSSCALYCNCKDCGTNVYFCIRPEKNGEETLRLVVRRKIPRFRGCTDPAWIKQVTDPAEFEGLERDWYAASDEGSEATQRADPPIKYRWP